MRSVEVHAGMPTMTSTLRGTPSLTVAPTQNTAPVFEFRCLYTHDLRKKKKIWHDGSLRFHTFNRRVMVYDDSKNYIGDAHWRETGDFQEGEELKLDKGVMVEVGEQIGQTETDLAPIILDKRRPETASSPPRIPITSNTYSSLQRPPASISQVRPKSLAAVLGASQGPIGRARFSIRSPFEQRQENMQRQPGVSGEPPLKKPRIAPEKENQLHNPNHATPVHCPEGRLSRTARALDDTPGPRVQASLVRNRPLESSAALPVPLPRISSRPVSEDRGRYPQGDIAARENILPQNPFISKSTRRPLHEKTRSHVAPASRPDTKSREETSPDRTSMQTRNPPTERSVASERSSASIVTNKLRFLKDKPRKKLMYEDLLPYVRQQKKKRISNTVDNQIAREQDQTKKARASRQSKDLAGSVGEASPIIDLVSDDGNPQIAAETPIHRPAKRANQEILNPSPGSVRSPSPLFVRQSPHAEELIASQRSLEGDFELPPESKSPSQRTVTGERTEVTREPEEDSLNYLTRSRHFAEVSTTYPAAVVPNPAPSNLTLLDQRLLQNPAAAQFASERSPHQASKQKPFRRILSEGDSHALHQKGVHSTDGHSIATDVTGPSVLQASEQLQKPFKSPTKIQRSVSDITHLAQRNDMIERGAPIPAAVEAGFDPWSEPEAYLLFDWWPPGRRKPCFDVNGTNYGASDEGL